MSAAPGPGTEGPTEAAVLQAARAQVGSAACTVQGLALEQPAGFRELSVDVVLGGELQRLVLQRHSVRAPDFRVLAQGGDGAWREVAVPEAQTYRGYVAGCGGSAVAATVGADGLRAVACLESSGEGTWVIEPLQATRVEGGSGQHVVYRSGDASETGEVCGHQEAALALASAPRPASDGTTALDVRVCRIACDADTEFFALSGSSETATAQDIETVINGVSAIYERDTQVSFQITRILVRTAEPDPYTSSNANALLGEFRLQWTSQHGDVPRDLAQLFTGKNFGTILGNGYTDAVCPGFDHYSLVRSRWQTDLGKRIALSAHEIGHNFTAVHCDYDVDPRCRIMCPNLGGCSNGYRSFEPSNIARIRARAARAGCLAAGTVATPSTSLPFADNFDAITYPPRAPDPARWTAADLAECQYKHLEIRIGRDYSYNQMLGTVRTLPMPLSGPAKVNYRVNPGGIPTTQSLKIEYFDSTAYTWRDLRTIRSDGSSAYASYEDTAPTNGYGDYFAIRFSAYGTAYTSSTSWSVDDVSIVALPPVAPPLSITRTATNTVAISWPQPAIGWTLETTGALSNDLNPWTPLPPPYPTNATDCVVAESLSSGARFYRLRSAGGL